MSWCRNVVIDMLAQNLISNKIIIYVKKDREFLYSKIFRNIVHKESVDEDKVVEYCNDTFNKNYIYTNTFSFVRFVLFFLGVKGYHILKCFHLIY